MIKKVGQKLHVMAAEVGLRLDLFLVKRLQLSRSVAQEYIERGLVLIGQAKSKSSQRLRAGEVVSVRPDEVDVAGGPPFSHARSAKAELPLPTIVFRDDDLMVIDKPAGIAVQGTVASGATAFTAWLVKEAGEFKTGKGKAKPKAKPKSEAKTKAKTKGQAVPGSSLINNQRYPGLVHRLDKDTSGVMVVARNPKTLQALKTQFQERQIKKEYLVLVAGRMAAGSGKIEAPLDTKQRLGGRVRVGVESDRYAVTAYTVQENYGKLTLMLMQPLTGRTHQIRVHLRAIGRPILGDPIYGNRRWNRWAVKRLGLVRPFLHAQRLTFQHPGTKQVVTFAVPMAPELEQALARVPKLALGLEGGV